MRPPAKQYAPHAPHATVPWWDDKDTPDKQSGTSSPHARAEYATLKAFLNGYMLEVTAGAVIARQGAAPSVLEFDLPQSFARLRVAVRHWSITGPHDFGALYLCNEECGHWQRASVAEVLPMLVRDCFARHGTSDGPKLQELLRRILNSYDQIAKSCAWAEGLPSTPAEFLAAEQSLIFGHWLHPTPKSREGMTDWQAASYAPEFRGRFQLRFFAAHDSIALNGSTGSVSAQDMIRQIPGLDLASFALRPDEHLLPMHPLQAEALCLQPAVQALLACGQLRDLGPSGVPFAATSSVRTVYAPGCPWMFKFSLPVKITNSQRINLHHELEAGVVMARLLNTTGFLNQQPRFGVINDPGFMSLTLPGQRESGFEVIIRENPFERETAPVVTVAALTADPANGGRSMLARLVAKTAARNHMSDGQAAKRWFGAYLGCALHPALALYDKFGIALEAHQQNSLLDVREGFPIRYLFRDNQGYYIADSHIDALAQLEPRVTALKSVCYPEAEIRDRFGYYLILNQVFSVISRLSRDGLATETELLSQLRQALHQARATHRGLAKRFADHLLHAPELTFKGNLLTRVHNVDELRADGEKAIYVHRKNPLVSEAAAPAAAVPHVNA
ncbi:petrobactin biosynthesis protein AsbA [Roseobacter cerasinus]|uniref:Petrobactin biosynthesis protein AsbA n=1 Tax=Roseobacter cerasinus TaxID=2602289 RepID=A0A640VTU0_9RHOB|nr:IucA/IucC family protein [Roseobacter cerasinus]GFE51072.1 petrobactin biosynthesis protein AsbA [Roseobacter cerasinus]